MKTPIEITPGTWLSATALLNETVFQDAQIFIHQYDTEGAVGFITNQVFDRRLNELTEFAYSKPILLHDGGPVDREHLFILHCQPDLIPGSRPITDNIYFGGNFTRAVALLNNGQLSEKDIRILIGYCGWDKGELEAELAEGSWQIIKPGTATLF